MRVNTLLALSASLAASATAAPIEPIEIGTTEGTHIGIPELPGEIDHLPPGVHRPIPLDRTTGPEKREVQSGIPESVLHDLQSNPNATPEEKQKLQQIAGDIAAAGGFKKRDNDPLAHLTPQEVADNIAAAGGFKKRQTAMLHLTPQQLKQLQAEWAAIAGGPMKKRDTKPFHLTPQQLQQLQAEIEAAGGPFPMEELPKRDVNPIAALTPEQVQQINGIVASLTHPTMKRDVDPNNIHLTPEEIQIWKTAAAGPPMPWGALPPNDAIPKRDSGSGGDLGLTPEQIAELKAINAGAPLPPGYGLTKRDGGANIDGLTPQEIAWLRSIAAGPPIPGDIPKDKRDAGGLSDHGLTPQEIAWLKSIAGGPPVPPTFPRGSTA